MATPRTSPHIANRGGRPLVAGTRIKVSLIASAHEHMGMTAEEIVEAYPHLSIADVHAALGYYRDHTDAIRREWNEARRLIAEMRARFPSRLGTGREP